MLVRKINEIIKFPGFPLWYPLYTLYTTLVTTSSRYFDIQICNHSWTWTIRFYQNLTRSVFQFYEHQIKISQVRFSKTDWQTTIHTLVTRAGLALLYNRLWWNPENCLVWPGLAWHNIIKSPVPTLSIISSTRSLVSRDGIVNLSRTSHLAKIQTIRLNFLEKSIIIKSCSLTSPFRQVELSLDRTSLALRRATRG